jgi:carboxylate-amine ligase
VRIDFTPSQRTSLGVEWELELVDLETGELRGGATELLAELGAPHGGEHPKAKNELFDSCVEVITGICATAADVMTDLQETVDEVATAAARRGLGLLCSGTHPTTDWSTQDISPKDRYVRLVETMQWPARRMQIFGVHVHVGVQAEAKVMPIVNALTAYVPHFLALSASSPYWIGRDTGLASARSKVFEALPTAGLPYQLANWAEFEGFMATLLASGTIASIKDVWWDIRPHPEFGTVELRICDGLSTLVEVGMVAALAQCLVEQLDGQLERGYTLPTPTAWIVRENKWRATRYGLDAEVIIDDTGRTAPLRPMLEEQVAELMPIAQRLGCTEQLGFVAELLGGGASYQRQRAVAAANGGDLHAVVDSLLAEFRAGHPLSIVEAER